MVPDSSPLLDKVHHLPKVPSCACCRIVPVLSCPFLLLVWLRVFHFLVCPLGLPSLRPCIFCAICRPTILPCVVPLPPIQYAACQMIPALQAVSFPLHEHHVHPCIPCLISWSWSSINAIHLGERLAKKLS